MGPAADVELIERAFESFSPSTEYPVPRQESDDRQVIEFDKLFELRIPRALNRVHFSQIPPRNSCPPGISDFTKERVSAEPISPPPFVNNPRPNPCTCHATPIPARSEERRVGKECRSRWS